MVWRVVSCEAERRLTGDAIRGKEHLGRPTPPMGESAISAFGVTLRQAQARLGRPVDTRLGHKARIGVYDSCPKIRAPPFEPKESVA